MLKRKILLCMVSLLIVPAVIFSNEGTSTISFGKDNSYILIDRLLSLSVEPIGIRDQLSRYKEWEKVFIKYHGKSKLSISEMKVYLFITFISEEKVIVQAMEDIHFDILSKFENQPENFIRILKELPFLRKHSCNAIRNHFIIADKLEQKPQFTKKYKPLFIQILGTEIANECLQIIE